MSFLFGLGLENFRIFEEKQEFEFAPITILTGTNSSGKSTVTNALRILKELFGNKPLIKWNNNELQIDFKSLFQPIDHTILSSKFGEFKNLKNLKSNNERISFEIPLFNDVNTIPNLYLEIIYTIEYKNPTIGKIETLTIKDKKREIEYFKIFLEENEYYTTINYIDFYLIYLKERELINEIEKTLNKDSKNTKKKAINILKKELFGEYDVSISLKNDKIKTHEPYPLNEEFAIYGGIGTFETSLKFLKGNYRYFNDLSKIQSKIIADFSLNRKNSPENEENIIDKILNDSIEFDEISNITYEDRINLSILKDLSNRKIKIGNLKNSEMSFSLEFLQNIPQPSDKIKEYLKSKGIEIKENYDINDIFSISPTKNIISNFGKSFFIDFVYKNINLNILRNLEVKNLYFFDNKTNFETRRIDLNKNQSNLINEAVKFSNDENLSYYQLEFLKKWIHEFSGFEKIEFEISNETMVPLIYKNGIKLPLIDEGSGINRIIPIIFKICRSDNKIDQNIICIEEPETGLHPALQSKIADMLYDAHKYFNIQFIIETHSEYLIRRYQVLVASKKVYTEDVKIYYFYHPDTIPEGEIQCYPIEIEADGSLTKNFGKGFFDESSNLNISLYQFSSNNKN